MNEAAPKIECSWQMREDRLYLVAYWSRGSRLVNPLIDYCLHLTDEKQLNSKTVRNEITLLKAVFEFAERNRISIEELDDGWLKRFRDEEAGITASRKISSGSMKTAKRTVNMKLRRTYFFLAWYQTVTPGLGRLIGERNCRVTSGLTVNDADSVRPRAPGKRYSPDRGRKMFPLLFRGVGEGSRHRVGYAANQEDKAAIRTWFRQNFTSFVSTRNILIMNIADATGLRRGSINSLQCEQFSQEMIDGAGSHGLKIQPAEQKFGYENFFRVPLHIARQVRSFIVNERAALMEEMGWNEKRAKERIFISARDGRPLRDQTISAIFGKAFQNVGAPRGAGLHSFRRKSAEDKIHDEIVSRIQLGLDTSVASVSASVAIDMGHRNPASLAPYVSRSQGKIAISLSKNSEQSTPELEDGESYGN
jgi:hypothetical protein